MANEIIINRLYLPFISLISLIISNFLYIYYPKKYLWEIKIFPATILVFLCSIILKKDFYSRNFKYFIFVSPILLIIEIVVSMKLFNGFW